MEKKFETGLLVQRNNEMLVDARLLHQRLNVGKKFADWIKFRIYEFGFEENRDFVISQKTEIKGQNGGDRRSIDYHLSIDMAKELAMLERNETGRKIRRYFIEAEKVAAASSATHSMTLSHTMSELSLHNLKPLLKKATRINGRRLLPYREFAKQIGLSPGGSLYDRRKRYPGHFVDFNRMVYVTEELANVILLTRQVRVLRLHVTNMQPVLPLNFGSAAELTPNTGKGGRSCQN